MCGIAGLFDLRGTQSFDADLLGRMNQAQFHRGPDEGGTFLEPGVALAHRRLSIIDLSAGQQPMHSADGNICVVYNGEIYNFRELTAQLQQLGYTFRTHCDTEVILYAWQEWGEACVERFRGLLKQRLRESVLGGSLSQTGILTMTVWRLLSQIITPVGGNTAHRYGHC